MITSLGEEGAGRCAGCILVSTFQWNRQVGYLMITEGQFSSVLHKNICCGYSLESPRWGDSNEYPQCMFLRKNKQKYPLLIIKYPSYLFHWHFVVSGFTLPLGARGGLQCFIVPLPWDLFILVVFSLNWWSVHLFEKLSAIICSWITGPTHLTKSKWAATWQNQQTDMCTQWRLRSACAST